MKMKVIIVVVVIVCACISCMTILKKKVAKQAIKPVYSSSYTSIDLYNNTESRLICELAQSTGSWLQAIAIETSSGEYSFFEKGFKYNLVVSGNDPFVVLKEELTLYGKNRFIISGELNYRDDLIIGKGWSITIEEWNVVYPVKTTFRPFYMWNAIYIFDYK